MSPVAVGPTHVDIEVHGPIAEWVVTRSFENAGDALVEAELWLWIPPDAAVDAVNVTVGDRTFASEVAAWEVAARTYQEATRAGHTASLLQVRDEDVAVQRISNIAPGEDVSVEVHLLQTLAPRAGRWSLSVPVTVAPRLRDPAGDGPLYGDGGAAVDLRVDVRASDLAWIESGSHPFRSGRDRGGAWLQVEGAEREVAVSWSTAAQDPTASLWVASGYALLQWEAPAPWAKVAPPPFDLVLLVDASDSQIGAWPRVTAAVDELIRALRPDDRVTVLVFADAVAGLAVRRGPEARQDVLERLARVPLGGGTGLAGALGWARALPVPPGRPKTVVVLSDGGTDEALPDVPGARVHAVGVGAALVRPTLARLARAGGGVVAEVGALDEVIAALGGPVATDLRVEWAAEGLPAEIGPLYAGGTVTVAARGAPCAPVVVEGRYLAAPFRQSVAPQCGGDPRALEVAWARRAVEAAAARGDDAAGLKLALEHQIASRYTGLVGVDGARPRPGTAVAVTVPERAPYGDPSISGGATNENTYILDGANVTEPVAGTFSLNFDFDSLQYDPDRNAESSLRRSEDDLWARVPALPAVQLSVVGLRYRSDLRAEVDDRDATDLVGGGSHTVGGSVPSLGRSGPGDVGAAGILRAVSNTGINRAVGGVELRASSLDSVSIRATASGPIDQDRLWMHGAGTFSQTSLGGVEHTAPAAGGTVTWQPNHTLRTVTGGYLDASTVDDIPIGARGASLRQWLYPNPRTMAFADVSVARQELGDAWRELRAAETRVLLDADLLHGEHHAEAGLAASETRWVGARTTWLRAYAADILRVGRWDLRGGARLDVAGAAWVSPRVDAEVRVGPIDTRVRVSGGRRVDMTRFVPGSAPETDEARAGLSQRLPGDQVLAVAGTVQRDRLPFRSAVQLLADPLAEVPEVVRTTGALDVTWTKELGHRWWATATWTWSAAPPPPDLATSEAAPLVAGFLEPYRRHAVAGSAFWDLPIDPWTVSAGVFGRASTAVRDARGAWWVEPSALAGAVLAQRIDVRRGELEVSGSVVWAKNTLGAPWLPAEAWVLLGDRASPASAAATRAEIRLAYRL